MKDIAYIDMDNTIYNYSKAHDIAIAREPKNLFPPITV